MRYLTVHDVIWMNTALTGQPQTYHFDRLENAVYSQYSYGDSRNLLKQAADMLQRLYQDKPFAQGNELTAVVATATFLRLNGYELRLTAETLPPIIEQLSQGKLNAKEVVWQHAQPTEKTAGSLREVVNQVCQQLGISMKGALAEVH